MWKLETPLLELLARGTLLYLVILLFLRIMPRRTGGEIAAMDLVLVLLITESASHALGDYTSLADGFVLIAMLMSLNYLINAISFRFKWFERIVSSPPLQIVRDGQYLRRNMRREFVTEEELTNCLRQNNIDDIPRSKPLLSRAKGRSRSSLISQILDSFVLMADFVRIAIDEVNDTRFTRPGV